MPKIKQRDPIKIYKAEALLIPLSQLTTREVEKAHNKFLYRIYQESSCKRCEYLVDRHSDVCDSCEAYRGIQTSKVVEKKGKDFLSLPSGATKKVKKWLISIGQDENYEVVDKFKEPEKFSRPIVFTGTPYKYQKKATRVMLGVKRGILCSKPRSGKTVMATSMICDLGVKTLVIASQIEWLQQFQATFLGGPTQDRMTNAKARQVKICKTIRDFETTDVALCTFSQFMKSDKILKQIYQRFGVIFVDECFTKDHEVLTDKGYMAINELVAGGAGKVLSFNHGTQKQEWKPISRGFMRPASQGELVEVTVNGNKLVCTATHPFWSETRKEYVAAKDLLPGEQVQTIGESHE